MGASAVAHEEIYETPFLLFIHVNHCRKMLGMLHGFLVALFIPPPSLPFRYAGLSDVVLNFEWSCRF